MLDAFAGNSPFVPLGKQKVQDGAVKWWLDGGVELSQWGAAGLPCGAAAVGICKGELLIEKVTLDRPVACAGLIYLPATASSQLNSKHAIYNSHDDGQSKQPGALEEFRKPPVLVVAHAAAPPDVPPTVTAYLNIGPVTTRLVGWRRILGIKGLPLDSGVLIAGEAVAADGETVTTITHTLHPLTPPKVLQGPWGYALHTAEIHATPAPEALGGGTLVHVWYSRHASASAHGPGSPPPGGKAGAQEPQTAPQSPPKSHVCLLQFAATEQLEKKTAAIPRGDPVAVPLAYPGSMHAWQMQGPESGAGTAVVLFSKVERAAALVHYSGRVEKFEPKETRRGTPDAIDSLATAGGCLVTLQTPRTTEPGGMNVQYSVAVYLTPAICLYRTNPLAPRPLASVSLAAIPTPNTFAVVEEQLAPGAPPVRSLYRLDTVPKCPLAKQVLQCVTYVLPDPGFVVTAFRAAAWGAPPPAAAAAGDCFSAPWRGLCECITASAEGPPPRAPSPGEELPPRPPPLAALRSALDGKVDMVRTPMLCLLRRQRKPAISLHPPTPPPNTPGAPPAATFVPSRHEAEALLCVLHLCHESFRVTTGTQRYLVPVARLVVELAVRLRLRRVVEYYDSFHPGAFAEHADQLLAGGGGGGEEAEGQRGLVSRKAVALLGGKVAFASWFAELPAPPDLFAFVNMAIAMQRPTARAFPLILNSGPAGDAHTGARLLCQISDLRLGVGVSSVDKYTLPVLRGPFSEVGSHLPVARASSELSWGWGKSRDQRAANPHYKIVIATLKRALAGYCAPGTGESDQEVLAGVLRSLTVGPAVMLLQSLATARSSPPEYWDTALQAAVGRHDIARLHAIPLPLTPATPFPQPSFSPRAGDTVFPGFRQGHGASSDAPRKPVVNDFLASRDRHIFNVAPLTEFAEDALLPQKPPRAESTCITDRSLGVDVGSGPPSIGHRLLWGEDARLGIAQSLLCSAVPISLPGSSADDGMADPQVQQQQLAAIVNRVLAVPCGRGMLTLTTVANISGSTLPQPPLVLCGRRSRDQAFTSLDLSGYAADTTLWPQFLNSCSAALRLQTTTHLGANRVYIRDWVASAVSPSQAPTASTAGVILGLGLLGHLELLSGSELYYLMFPRYEATTVALLLGLAACHRGTGEKRVSAMLSLHLAPIAPHYTEQDVAPGMQTAAIVGVGLLYEGTCHRLMADMLLGELSRPPSDEHSYNLHGYALCTGFSLGLVCLCKGGEATHLADLRLLDRLLALLSATRRDHIDPKSASGAGTAAKQWLAEEQFGPGTGVPLSLFNKSSGDNGSSKVLVGPLVETNITAPAAAAALGLMFMKSSNEVVFSALQLPTTAALLVDLGPDAVMNRMIAASLVKWDSVDKTQAWIESMTPSVLLDIVECSADELTFSDKTPSVKAAARRSHNDRLHQMPGTRQQLHLIYAYIVAGAAFALGLRYAGSGDEQVRDLLLETLSLFLKSKVACAGGKKVTYIFPETAGNKASIDPCINATALAASCVMAGSGCSATFKVLRTLQKRKDAGYGSHMATGMAIGMLFLGSGRRTLMTSPHAVASLYISLYPRFPTVATDNTYHPQFLRPLYVLATVPRILETRDVDTGDSCAVPVRINGAKEVTPCVFPPNNSLETLEVEAGCDYYRLSLTRAIPRHQSMLVGGVVWVKKKPSPANDGIYKALHGEGPLNVASIIGTEPDRVHHAVASVTQQLVKGLDTTLQGLWDVKTAVAAVEHPPTRVLETAEVLSKIFPSSCRLTLDAHYEGALRTAVRKFSSPDVALTPAELRALAWFSIPADRGILEKASRSRSEFIAAFPLVSPAVFTLFDGE